MTEETNIKEVVLDEKTEINEEKKEEVTSSTESPVVPKEERKEIECRYCNDKEHPDRVAHLVCIEMADGHIHVHAPFSDRRAIYRFLDSIEIELARHKRAPEPKKREDALK